METNKFDTDKGDILRVWQKQFQFGSNDSSQSISIIDKDIEETVYQAESSIVDPPFEEHLELNRTVSLLLKYMLL